MARLYPGVIIIGAHCGRVRRRRAPSMPQPFDKSSDNVIREETGHTNDHLVENCKEVEELTLFGESNRVSANNTTSQVDTPGNKLVSDVQDRRSLRSLKLSWSGLVDEQKKERWHSTPWSFSST